MKNKKITRKITQGMYVLTTKDGVCIVDAVSQVSAGKNPLIAVSVIFPCASLYSLIYWSTSFSAMFIGEMF